VLLTYSPYLPLTLRQVYYRLISTHEEYPKTEAFYERLGTVMARARRASLISWDDIRDDGIQNVLCGDGYDGPDDFFQSIKFAAQAYTRDKHCSQPRQIVLICEAAGMVPQMEHAVGHLPVTIQTCGEMDSVTAKYRLAQLCGQRDTTILHVGDWDPGGISIYHGIALDVGAMVRASASAFCQSTSKSTGS
jgi:hypothetical protein